MDNTQNQPFVTRFEQAITQFVILNKAKEGEVTRENIQSQLRTAQFNVQHLDACVKQLVQDGHIKEQGNKYTITDDGREDVQKLQNVIIHLPSLVGGASSSQQPPNRPQPQATPGYSGAQTGGNTPSRQSGQGNPGQPKTGR